MKMNNEWMHCLHCKKWFYEKGNFGDMCPECVEVLR